MANRNKKKLKKRKKRQLKKQFKQTSKIEVQQVETPVNKYEEENKLYQEALEKKYNGTVTVTEQYINPRAVLLHHCSGCSKDFFAKPLWLVNSVQPHECYSHPMEIINKPKISGKKRLSQADKDKIVALFKQGMSMSQIANLLNTTRQTVSNHVKKAGLW
ncbi:helix-turn-helix domain-containing protein [Niallia sp. 03133]|uniref:helix-turn-helix domain-containing protein n=1 Tax=Niallia sp. 03133 TaxID=3458060 RepID=UPI00404424B9